MSQKVLKYGLISGSFIVLIPVISGWIIGTDPETFRMGEIIGYSTMVLSLLLIFWAVKEYKATRPAESLTFTQIFLIGAGISAIAGMMFGIYNWVYVTYISPDFMDQYFNYYIDNIRNSGASTAEIDAKITKLNEEKALFMNPFVSFFAMFITVFMIGIVISIVSGLSQSTKSETHTNL